MPDATKTPNAAGGASDELKALARKRAIKRLIQLRRIGSPIWAPHQDNKPQCKAFETKAQEILYGGGGGGGKSDLLLGAALTRHKKSVLFRKQQTDSKALIDRGREIAGDFGTWKAQDRAIMTNDGREVEFGHCSRPGDEQSWQGRAHDLKGFDELAHFTEAQYLFLSGWLRSTDPNQFCQIIGASNPPTSAEGGWIIRRWAPWLDNTHPNPAEDGEIRWFATIDGVDTEVAGPEPFEHVDQMGVAEQITPRSRTFIQALVDDNPYYRRSGYKSVLQSLPEPLRSILLYGRFDAAMEDDPWQVIPTAWIQAAMDRWSPNKPGPMSAAGVDVARAGRAQTVMARRHGDWFDELLAWPGTETDTGVAAAGLIIQALRDGAPAQVDIIGVGAAAYEHLTQAGVPAAAMDARHKSSARDRSGKLGFYNLRSEWWWKFREALDPEAGDNLALPNDSELRADLASPRWEPFAGGVKVEPKENIEDRLGRSVDKGDAVIMALPQAADPVEKREGKRRHRRERADNRYDALRH